jgi:hypothetical protein
MRSSSFRAWGLTPVRFPWIVGMDPNGAADGGSNQGLFADNLLYGFAPFRA